METNQVKLQYITMSFFFIDIFFNKFFTFFSIKNALICYNIYLLYNINNVIEKEKINSESLLFYSIDCLTFEKIDYNFDIGNYLVNITIDDSVPVLYIFSILNHDNNNILTTKKLSSDYHKIFNTDFVFELKGNTISILPDTECILYVTIQEM
jgi:hypothetical protein